VEAYIRKRYVESLEACGQSDHKDQSSDYLTSSFDTKSLKITQKSMRKSIELDEQACKILPEKQRKMYLANLEETN
jgi:hypothetical protein